MSIFRRSSRVNSSVTASAMQVRPDDSETIRRINQAVRPWQIQAMNLYRQMGVLHYPANYYANGLSRFRLFIGETPQENPAADPRERTGKERSDLYKAAEEILLRLQGDQGGHPEILRAYGINRMMPADCWLAGQDRASGTNWEILSLLELRPMVDGTFQRFYDGGWIPSESYKPNAAFRFWNADPFATQRADGPMESLAADCERLLILERSMTARMCSALAQAGYLYITSEMTMPGEAPTGDGQVVHDPFALKLFGGMEKSILDGTGKFTPDLIRGPSGQEPKFITVDRVIDRVEMELRVEMRDNIAKGLDLPPEAQQGMNTTNHWCVDEETEALTLNGWVQHSDLKVGDEVLTLNHETGLSEWQPVEDIYRADVTHEPMVTFTGQKHDSKTTLNHRWPVWMKRGPNGAALPVRGWRTSETLRVADRIIVGAPCADQPAVAKYADDLVELVAWFWTEGSIHGPRAVVITQSHSKNPERCDRIRAALTRLYGPASADLRGISGPAWREDAQAKPHASAFGGPITRFSLNVAASEAILAATDGTKRVSFGFVHSLTPAQLRLFVEVSEQGDGQHYRMGANDIWQRKAEDLDAYELAYVLLGRGVSRTQNEGGHRATALRQVDARPLKAADQQRRTGSGTNGGATHTITPYSGVVWCPVTANRTWFARRNGTHYFTGNSTWQVTDDVLSGHMEPAVRDFCQGLNRVYLWPLLEDWNAASGSRFDLTDIRRLSVCGDGSGVAQRPNSTEDTRQLFDRPGTIKRSVLRASSNASDDDAPDETEYVQQIGVKINNPYLATWGMPVHDKIDWEAVAATPAGEGAPGAGGTPPSRRPADPSKPDPVVPEPAEPKVPAADQSSLVFAVAADGHLLAARKQVGAQVRALAAKNKTIAASIKSAPNEKVLATLDDWDAIGLDDVKVRTLYTEALDPLTQTLSEFDPGAVALFVAAVSSLATSRQHSPITTADLRTLAYSVLSRTDT